MNRILDFSPSQEEAVVARILVLVHQAIDEHFPAAEQANRQFTKTVFSGDGESTASVKAAPDTLDAEEKSGSAFALDEATKPDGHPSEASATPDQAEERPEAVTSERPQPFASHTNPLNIAQAVDGHSTSTRLDTTIEGMQTELKPDWVMRITVALLIAGLVLLTYVIFV